MSSRHTRALQQHCNSSARRYVDTCTAERGVRGNMACRDERAHRFFLRCCRWRPWWQRRTCRC
uniref:Uncharacterized protein n=1 Tax=Arundo donax TaxID=35708 RepID=A0A0A9HY71_ARUDO